MTDKIATVSLDEVARIADTLIRSERMADGNEALLLHYLISALRENEQRQELVIRMGLAIEQLDRKGVSIEEAFRTLKHDHERLKDQVVTESARIDMLGATLTAVFDKLSSVAKQAEADGKMLADLAENAGP